MSDEKKKLTTGFGMPIDNDLNSVTAGPKGPVLMQDVHLTEKLAHFDRERIPERVVHAKGAGAHGYFEVTADVTGYTRARFLSEVGKRTDVFLRFSTVGGERGSADSERDPRGFAVKLYTEEGNYDLVGNNTPVFFIRDPLKFPDFIHTQKRNPATNLKDPDMFWDFLSLTPESIHQVTILFSDRGTPRTYRHMNGYSSHTYMWYNEAGDHVWVQYHFKTEQGIENFTAEEADRMRGIDPDCATRDLYEAIDRGDYPAWRLEVQVMTPEEAESYRFDPFDITKVWPHADFPPIEVGRLVLNRNPENYFAEVERIRCCRAGCSAMPTPSDTVWAPTTIYSPSTPRSAPCPAISEMGRCDRTTMMEAVQTTGRTAWAALRRIPVWQSRPSMSPAWPPATRMSWGMWTSSRQETCTTRS